MISLFYICSFDHRFGCVVGFCNKISLAENALLLCINLMLFTATDFSFTAFYSVIRNFIPLFDIYSVKCVDEIAFLCGWTKIGDE